MRHRICTLLMSIADMGSFKLKYDMNQMEIDALQNHVFYCFRYSEHNIDLLLKTFQSQSHISLIKGTVNRPVGIPRKGRVMVACMLPLLHKAVA